MRVLAAVAAGLAPVLLLMLLLAVADPVPEGETSPEPLLTTVPSAPSAPSALSAPRT
ncbi:SPW_0924 family protein [Streptomyces coeruleoprunus]|uniref:SPW_0924 family protein n=1 Tax=Streptomyces coeruleoprunus TaxID=285563 RepID=A0ABV9XMR6_9ACTN